MSFQYHLREVDLALSRLSFHKVGGPDGVTLDVLRACPEWTIPWLTVIFNQCLRTQTIRQSWKDANLVPILQGKNDAATCDNHRGTSLLPVPGKVFSHILLQRLIHVTHRRMLDALFDLRRLRGTAQACGILQRLLESGAGLPDGVHALSIDFPKAFDRVGRHRLWDMLHRRGLPLHFVQLLANLYSGNGGRILSEQLIGEWFGTNNGVSQGSKEGPCLFNVFIDSLGLGPGSLL